MPPFRTAQFNSSFAQFVGIVWLVLHAGCFRLWSWKTPAFVGISVQCGESWRGILHCHCCLRICPLLRHCLSGPDGDGFGGFWHELNWTGQQDWCWSPCHWMIGRSPVQLRGALGGGACFVLFCLSIWLHQFNYIVRTRCFTWLAAVTLFAAKWHVHLFCSSLILRWRKPGLLWSRAEALAVVCRVCQWFAGFVNDV